MPDNKATPGQDQKQWEVEGKPEGQEKAGREVSSGKPGEDRTPDKKIGEIKYAEVNSTGKKP
jgi:hypothetical protein